MCDCRNYQILLNLFQFFIITLNNIKIKCPFCTINCATGVLTIKRVHKRTSFTFRLAHIIHFSRLRADSLMGLFDRSTHVLLVICLFEWLRSPYCRTKLKFLKKRLNSFLQCYLLNVNTKALIYISSKSTFLHFSRLYANSLLDLLFYSSTHVILTSMAVYILAVSKTMPFKK